MAELKRLNLLKPPPPPQSVEETVREIERGTTMGLEPIDLPPNFKTVISTGSTLVDLAISGNRVPGGGIPSGIMVEIYGPSGAGKTALLNELGASARIRGGEAKYKDPEGRLDKEYSRIYGLRLAADDYDRPRTVEELFDFLEKWEPKNMKVSNAVLTDSLAALSSGAEQADNDAYGMARAKAFSQGFRKISSLLTERNILIVAANQVRQSPSGEEVRPGGEAITFYSSLILRVSPGFPKKYIQRKRKVTVKGKEVEEDRILGIISDVTVKKSSVDDPFRKVPLYITFHYGVDDLQANLQWYKDKTGGTRYGHRSEVQAVSMENSLELYDQHEKEDKSNLMVEELRQEVIGIWYEIERQIKRERKPKHRI
jgi:recombination protein RecA